MKNNELLHQKIRECIGMPLESNEELYLVIRKHWIILVETWLLLLTLWVLCGGIYFIGNFARIPIAFTLMTMIGMLMVGIQYIFVHWVNNELDILIVTNRRIIAYDQVKFLDRKMSQTTIDLVQEVNASTSWLIGNLLHYGNMMVRTASDTSTNVSDFNMTHISNPIETSRKIHSFIDEYRHLLDISWQK